MLFYILCETWWHNDTSLNIPLGYVFVSTFTLFLTDAQSPPTALGWADGWFLRVLTVSHAHRRQLQGAAPRLKVNQGNIGFIITLASFDFIYFPLWASRGRVSACQATDLGRNLHPGRPDVNSAGIFMSCAEAYWAPCCWGSRQMDVGDQLLQTNHSREGPNVICLWVCVVRVEKDWWIFFH